MGTHPASLTQGTTDSLAVTAREPGPTVRQPLGSKPARRVSHSK